MLIPKLVIFLYMAEICWACKRKCDTI